MRLMPLIVLAAVALGGCATGPRPLEDAPSSVSLAAARQDPERHLGKPVTWGGSIAAVDNRAEETCLEIVGRDLRESGRPQRTDRSEGRFLACVNRFLDPMVYSQGRQVTVSGTLAAVERRPVGQYPYVFPVVQTDKLHLWQPEPERPRYVEPDPFYSPWPYHPFYHPWYGFPPPWYHPLHHRKN